MNRRHLLALAVPLLAGCTSTSSEPSDGDSPDNNSSSDSNPDTDSEPDGVPDIDLAAEGVQAEDADVSLEIAYNAMASKEFQTGQYTTTADDGEKWLGVRMVVTNTGDTQRELIVRHYTVDVDGQEYEVVYFDEPYSLRGKTVAPGETVTGWIFYSIPTDTTEATLRVNQGDLTRFDVSLSYDASIPVTSSDG